MFIIVANEEQRMSRPKKDRTVAFPPLYTSFKPTGVRTRNLRRINLSLDEYEALRLADYEGLDHLQAAQRLGISRPTFTRLIDAAHRKIALFVQDGCALTIDGGACHFTGNIYTCTDCGRQFRSRIDTVIEHCPECGSDRLEDAALDVGHGECCREHTGTQGDTAEVDE
jgi:predicted DNA-binding protein (UPF0251 family)